MWAAACVLTCCTLPAKSWDPIGLGEQSQEPKHVRMQADTLGSDADASGDGSGFGGFGMMMPGIGLGLQMSAHEFVRCETQDDCESHEFCKRGLLNPCSGHGECAKLEERTADCVEKKGQEGQAFQACDCDGRTHSSACELAPYTQVNVASMGACEPPPAVLLPAAPSATQGAEPTPEETLTESVGISMV